MFGGIITRVLPRTLDYGLSCYSLAFAELTTSDQVSIVKAFNTMEVVESNSYLVQWHL